VLAFRELADGGLGLNRGRCTLDGVWRAATCRRFSEAPAVAQYESGDKSPHSKGSSGALVYSSEDQLFRSVRVKPDVSG
jgi:hypothetical protein